MNDTPLPDKILTCWCGEQGTYEELFDDADCDERCGGTGYRHCYCGGDLCVCHLHGGVKCDGCKDCGYDDDDDDLGEDEE